jgi:ankyrin repeat protein
MEYAKEKDVKLKINENDIEKVISKNLNNVKIKKISEIKNKFINRLYKYKNENIIEINYSKNGCLKKRIEKFIEERKNKKNEKNRNYNEILLTYECKRGNIKEVKKLISNGAKINQRNKDGDTPLIIACKKGNKKLVKYLLKHKEIDINKNSKSGISPLFVACYFKNKDLVNYLIDHNAKVDIFDNKENSPLHIACYLNSTEIIKFLKSKDIDIINKENSYKYTPLKIAEELKNEETKNYLIDNAIENNDSDSENTKCSSSLINENMSIKMKPISNNKYNNIKNNSICQIKINKNNGTGFFIEIPVPSKEFPIRGLMTNSHIINENILKSDKSFIIYKAEKAIEIKIKENLRFVFTSELLDVTFMELDDDIIDDIEPEFLYPCDKDAEDGESILIFQYAKIKYSLAHGNIKYARSFNYYHEAPTASGSSGSPLLNNEFKVVGIHKSKKIEFNKNDDNENQENNDKKCINIATKYTEIEFAIRKLYENSNLDGIEKARESAKELSDTEINELNEYGLQPLKLPSNEIDEIVSEINMIKEEDEKKIKLEKLKILKKSLFYCKFSKRLLFYRTNFSWYITVVSEKKSKNNYFSKDEYNLNDIRELKWMPITSNNEKIIKKIEKKIIGFGREHVLITWLGLTDLDYL